MANTAAVLPDRLVDRHGRRLGDLRISVTDRCNFRCTYCMCPVQVHRHRPQFGYIVTVAGRPSLSAPRHSRLRVRDAGVATGGTMWRNRSG